MKQRLMLASLVILSLAGAASCAGPGSSGSGGPRLIVLLTVEGMAQESNADLGVTSIPADLLAADPTSSEPFYTPSPVLRPAITSLMTGRTPLEHGVLDNTSPKLPAGIPTLAEDFRAGGFATAAFVASPLVSWLGGLERGFEIFDGAEGFAFAAFAHYPELRPAGQVVDNALRWLGTLPKTKRAFVWVHLADLSAPPELKGEGLDLDRRAPRIAELDQAVGRLRAALRDPTNQPAVLVVTSDRVQAIGSVGDLGQGFFVDPAFIRVPFVTEQLGTRAGWQPPLRPSGLVGVGAYLEEMAAIPGGRLAKPTGGESGVRMLSLSAVPHSWCRWSPGVVAAAGSDLWVFDGSYRRAGAKGGDAFEVSETEVPEPVRSRISAVVEALSKPPPRGPKVQEAVAVAHSYGIEFGADDFVAATPPQAQRRELVERLQRARAATVQNRPAIANRSYRALVEGPPPVLGAMIDRILFQALPGGSGTAAMETARGVLVVAGAHPIAIHWTVHAAMSVHEYALAEAFLQGYLEMRPDEPDALYDFACLKSLTGETEQSASYLSRSIEAGFRYWDLIENDPDLRTLRTDRRFGQVLKSHGR